MGKIGRKLLAVGGAWQAYDIIDASIVASSPEVALIDDRWVIVLDPQTIKPNDTVVPITVADLANSEDDDQDGEAE